MKNKASVQLVDAGLIIDRLTALAKRNEECGRISHALGVRICIDLIKRDLTKLKRAEKSPPALS